MAYARAADELRLRKYDWNKDPKHFKTMGVIPWERCLHCGSPYVRNLEKYCKECEKLMMFVEASSLITA